LLKTFTVKTPFNDTIYPKKGSIADTIKKYIEALNRLQLRKKLPFGQAAGIRFQ